MKITGEHYNHMFKAIESIGFSTMQNHKNAVVMGGKYKDLGKRLRNDFLYMSGLSAWVCDNLYPYADDSHIDTALRGIMKQLNFLEN